jgi:hypothetical protein
MAIPFINSRAIMKTIKLNFELTIDVLNYLLTGRYIITNNIL